MLDEACINRYSSVRGTEAETMARMYAWGRNSDARNALLQRLTDSEARALFGSVGCGKS